MRSDFIRNAERYYDPTAAAALTKIEREKRMDWKPGDIVTASKDTAEKKFIVLANDGYVLTGTVLLTREYDSFVPIICGGKMYANPYRLEYLNMNTYDLSLVRVATDAEMDALRAAIANILQIPTLTEEEDDDDDQEDESTGKITVSDEYFEMVQNQAKELIEATTRAAVYQSLYENLIARCLKTA